MWILQGDIGVILDLFSCLQSGSFSKHPQTDPLWGPPASLNIIQRYHYVRLSVPSSWTKTPSAKQAASLGKSLVIGTSARMLRRKQTPVSIA